MQKHIEYVHEKNYKYHCELCSKSFSGKDRLNNHKRIEHEGVNLKRFQCGKCKMFLVTKQSLEQHIKRIHDKITEEYKCNFCSKTYNRSDHL